MPRKTTLTADDYRTLIDSHEKRFSEWEGPLMISVSGGTASALAWHRSLEKLGPDNVIPVFADTMSEDQDLYRFLDDCETAFGQKIVRLSQGMDIWECFHKYGIMRIPSAGNACKASVELKRKPLDAFFKQSGAKASAFGLNFDEPERIVALEKAKSVGTCLFPLLSQPRLSSCEIHDEVTKLGIRTPTLYADGFIHNNCGGACILAGIGQWAGVLNIHPERFEYAETQEAIFIEKTGFTVLRDQSNNQVRPYPLSQLREDVADGRKLRRDWQSNCSCMTPLFD